MTEGMRLVKPTAKLYWNKDSLKHIEYCGRVCYNSYDKMTEDSAEKFIDGLIKRGHYSVLEHAAVNINAEGFQLSLDKVKETDPEFGLLMARANLGSLRCADLVRFDSRFSTAASLKDLPRATDVLTFEITASRSCTHQFVRHRNMSFCERSLRFVSVEQPEVVLPESPFLSEIEVLNRCFDLYKELCKGGTSKDEARAFLPMCTATKLIATAQATWWLEFLRLRLHPAASKEMIYIAAQIYDLCPAPIKEKAKELGLEKQFKEVKADVEKERLFEIGRDS